METIMQINEVVNNFVWGPPGLTLLVGTGVYLTLLLGLPQLRYFFPAMAEVFSFREKSEQDKSISSFAAMVTAMAATIGTGNVAGVATALHLAGPGALIWMLISAFFGMCTKFAEVTLAVHFRKKDAHGDWRGGPMYILEYGLGEWGELGGLILTRYKVMDFSTDAGHFDHMAIGQDFGFQHANAILLLGIKDGDVYICSEIYVHGKTKDEIIAIAEREGVPKHLIMWCDSAEPASIVTWRRNGYRAQGVEKEKDSVHNQIDWMKRRTIYIHPSCVNTIKEIQAWKYLLNKKTGEYEDEPTPIFDDAMAALRYGIEGWRDKIRYDRKKEG